MVKSSNVKIVYISEQKNRANSKSLETLIEMLHILSHQGNTNRIHFRYRLQHVRMPKVSNKTNHAVEDVEQS